MKFVIKGIRCLSVVIIMAVISSFLVILIFNVPRQKTAHEVIKINEYEISVNVSDRGNTYYLNHEGVLNNQEVVIIGFTILEATHEQVYLTIENNQEVMFLTVSEDYRATIIRNQKN